MHHSRRARLPLMVADAQAVQLLHCGGCLWLLLLLLFRCSCMIAGWLLLGGLLFWLLWLQLLLLLLFLLRLLLQLRLRLLSLLRLRLFLLLWLFLLVTRLLLLPPWRSVAKLSVIAIQHDDLHIATQHADNAQLISSSFSIMTCMSHMQHAGHVQLTLSSSSCIQYDEVRRRSTVACEQHRAHLQNIASSSWVAPPAGCAPLYDSSPTGPTSPCRERQLVVQPVELVCATFARTHARVHQIRLHARSDKCAGHLQY